MEEINNINKADNPEVMPQVKEADRAPVNQEDLAFRKAKRVHDEQADRLRDELKAKRLVDSPDLDDAVERLRPQVLSFKKFLDSSYHSKKFQEESGKIIKISEVQSAADELNKAIKEYRTQNKQFRAIDLWGASIEMPMTPSAVAIRPPYPTLPAEMAKTYFINLGDESFTTSQPLYIRIDAEGVSLVKESQKIDNPPSRISTTFDTLLLGLHGTGQFDKGVSKMIPPSATGLDSWKEIEKRAQQYGFTVNSEVYGKDDACYVLSIDLKSAGWEVPSGQYLRIEAGGSAGKDWKTAKIILSNKKGF